MINNHCYCLCHLINTCYCYHWKGEINIFSSLTKRSSGETADSSEASISTGELSMSVSMWVIALLSMLKDWICTLHEETSSSEVHICTVTNNGKNAWKKLPDAMDSTMFIKRRRGCVFAYNCHLLQIWWPPIVLVVFVLQASTRKHLMGFFLVWHQATPFVLQPCWEVLLTLPCFRLLVDLKFHGMWCLCGGSFLSTLYTCF